jgi:hypothetical protein
MNLNKRDEYHQWQGKGTRKSIIIIEEIDDSKIIA